ncbi:MAG: hypothetical protein WCJ30_06470, partial [Deltaproteobacteria bacterium]
MLWLLGCGGSPVGPPSPDADATVADATVAADAIDVHDVPSTDVARDVPTVDARTSCRSAADCAGDPAGAVCDLSTGRCVSCLPSEDTCPAGQHCDPSTSACADGCHSDDGCAVAASEDGGVSDARGDGGLGSRVCDTIGHRCVQCLGDGNCPAGTLCVGEVCVPGCGPGRSCAGGATCCDAACLDTQSNVAACGACGQRCTVANGSPACAAGRCTVAACTAPFADCNGDPADGCETDASSTVSDCGVCGHACAFAGATSECRSGVCALSACSAGFADCDADPANGCEIDLRTTASSCGSCGNACVFAGAGAVCVSGLCALGPCTAGFADCDGNPANGCEVALATNGSNCGRCGNPCSFAGGAAACLGGTCQLAACATGRGNCDGDASNGCETDLGATVASCGACGTACATPHATPACTMGACA